MSHVYALIVECAQADETIRAAIGRMADEVYELHPRMIRLEYVAGTNDVMEPVLRFVTPDDLDGD